MNQYRSITPSLFRVLLFKYQMAQYISNNKHIKHIEEYVKNCR